MPATLHVRHENSPAGTRRTIELRSSQFGSKDLWIEIPNLVLPAPDTWDPFLFAALQGLMERGEAVSVQGPVTQSAIYHLEELQEAWSRVFPQRYRKIPFHFEQVVPFPATAGQNYISAFSGGLDAIFTVTRHQFRQRGQASYPLGGALLVHGFDVPLHRTDSFEELHKRAKAFLDPLGLRLHVARTNLRQDWGGDWEMTHGAMLAACLHQFSSLYQGGLIASSYVYDYMRFPWGSSPVIDHLFANDAFAIIHDGAAYDRAAKVGAIHDNAAALACLKVCHEGPDPESNCGRCFKCLRTRLMLRSWGVEQTPTFPEQLSVTEIRQCQIRNEEEWRLLRRFVQSCRVREVSGDWLEALEKRLSAFEREERWKGKLRAAVGEKTSTWRALQKLRHRFLKP